MIIGYEANVVVIEVFPTIYGSEYRHAKPWFSSIIMILIDYKSIYNGVNNISLC